MKTKTLALAVAIFAVLAGAFVLVAAEPSDAAATHEMAVGVNSDADYPLTVVYTKEIVGTGATLDIYMTNTTPSGEMFIKIFQKAPASSGYPDDALQTIGSIGSTTVKHIDINELTMYVSGTTNAYDYKVAIYDFKDTSTSVCDVEFNISQSYTLKYDGNDDATSGATNVPTDSTIDWKVAVTTDNATTRLGYTLTSWNTKADGTGTTFETNTSYTDFPVLAKQALDSNGAITLYAQWTALEYTLNFSSVMPEVLNEQAQTNGSVSQAAITGLTYGTTVTISGDSFTVNGTTVKAIKPENVAYTYAFAKWTQDDGDTQLTSDNFTVVTSDNTDLVIEIKANWTPTINVYSVTASSADTDLGTLDVATITNIAYGTTVTLTDSTTAMTISAVKWDSTNNVPEASATVLTLTISAENKTIVSGEWKNVDGTAAATGTITQDMVLKGVVSATVSISAAVVTADTGYGTITGSAITIPYKSSVTIQGNTIRAINSSSAEAMLVAVAADPTYEFQHAFDKWVDAAESGSDVVDGIKTSIAQNTTYYADFTQSAREYTIILEGGWGYKYADISGIDTATYGSTVSFKVYLDPGLYTSATMKAQNSAATPVEKELTGTPTPATGSVQYYTVSFAINKTDLDTANFFKDENQPVITVKVTPVRLVYTLTIPATAVDGESASIAGITLGGSILVSAGTPAILTITNATDSAYKYAVTVTYDDGSDASAVTSVIKVGGNNAVYQINGIAKDATVKVTATAVSDANIGVFTITEIVNPVATPSVAPASVKATIASDDLEEGLYAGKVYLQGSYVRDVSGTDYYGALGNSLVSITTNPADVGAGEQSKDIVYTLGENSAVVYSAQCLYAEGTGSIDDATEFTVWALNPDL